MYEFHCKYIKSKFEPKLFFTDTYSFVYEIKTEDVYEDVYEDMFILVTIHCIQSSLMLLIKKLFTI